MFTKSLKVTDFTGQHIYVGIDVHLKSWMVSIYSDEFELKSCSQPPYALKLANYLKQHYPNATFHLAYKAGFCGFWIHRAFKEQGIEFELASLRREKRKNFKLFQIISK